MHIYNKQDPTAFPYLARLLGIIVYIVLMLEKTRLPKHKPLPVLLNYVLPLEQAINTACQLCW